MVFTHLPSNVMLMLIPLMPTLPAAIAMLLARHVLSQMDVPTRAAYIVGIVDPEERTAATGVTSLVRTLSGAIGPVIAGVALQVAHQGMPFLLGGGLKIIYDLALYASFRRIKPLDE
jgi:MFS family permease